MKELKIRCYDKPSCEFPNGGFTYVTISPATTVRIGDVDGFDLPTGLHDKNGVEIYEGDIVRVDPSGNTFVVIFRITGTSAGFTHEDGEGLYLPEYMEVIGNVHENPELLIK